MDTREQINDIVEQINDIVEQIEMSESENQGDMVLKKMLFSLGNSAKALNLNAFNISKKVKDKHLPLREKLDIICSSQESCIDLNRVPLLIYRDFLTNEITPSLSQ